MPAEETVLDLFDTYWFQYGVFTSKPTLSPMKTTPVVQEQDQEPAADKPKLNRITTLMRKSYSDQFLSSKDCLSDSPSPKSVLGPQLQTILSGKEVESFEDSSPKEVEISIDIHGTDTPGVPPPHTLQRGFAHTGPAVPDRRRKSRRSGSRSLSELEFEELKGFMDLGFVFPDEDRDSRLVSIIPGLQRRGKNTEDSDRGFDETSVSRPYLSEAWDCLEDEEKVRNPLMDWKIPAFGNEMELKDHLRFWAHTVASTVR